MSITSYTNCAGIEMRLLPAGSFYAGSPDDEQTRRENEGPQHLVEIDAFFISKTPITQVQYAAICKINPSFFSSSGKGHPHVEGIDTNQFPVESVSWEEADEFCKRVSEKEGHEKKEYRLPTEYEWEYACRAGTTTPFSTGMSFSEKDANVSHLYTFSSDSTGASAGRTTMVCNYPPNSFGLYDMHGNVWEWCENPYFGYGAKTVKPNARVLRGGAWNSYARFCRSAYRSISETSTRYYDTGFRIVHPA